MSTEIYERHIAALETQNRLLRRLAGVLLIGLVLVLSTALLGWNQIPDEVVARRFVVRNVFGNQVALLTSTEAGDGLLHLNAFAGQRMFRMGGAENNKSNFSLEAYDMVSRLRFHLGQNENENTSMSLFSGLTGKPREVSLGVFSDDVAGLRVLSGSSRILTALASSVGEGQVSLFARDGGIASQWRLKDNHSQLLFTSPTDRLLNKPSLLSINSPVGGLSATAKDGRRVMWPPTASKTTKKG